ncbi:helix-turn-helix domain-containing protein [Flindersiella endophytica]
MVTTKQRPVGELLRDWRQRRRLSQLDLALDAEISSRHLSFVETGRSRPSSEMILRLAERLEVPLRERNQLLLAGGFAPAYSESKLDAPEMSAVTSALRRLLDAHEPNPALIVDQGWDLVDANAGVDLFLTGAAPHLLEPPVNALRLSLHPDGMASRIANLAEWRAHILARLRRQAERSGSAELVTLWEELRAYPGGEQPETGHGSIVVPLRYRYAETELSFVSISAAFGTPMDVTVEELAIEAFYPADPKTAAFISGFLTRSGRP